jgi:hypothetical protein
VSTTSLGRTASRPKQVREAPLGRLSFGR